MYHHQNARNASPVTRLIDVLVHTMREHDAATAWHLERTGAFAEQVARFMRMPEPVIVRCRDAGRIHDIGKIDLDLTILHKPGPLTRAEWALIRLHPGRGEQILSEIPILASLAPIVGAHHERFDGRGYPQHRAGADMPIESRILAVADAFEAMISPRPYRRSLTVDEALAELSANAGSQFDPAVVAAFVDVALPADPLERRYPPVALPTGST